MLRSSSTTSFFVATYKGVLPFLSIKDIHLDASFHLLFSLTISWILSMLPDSVANMISLAEASLFIPEINTTSVG